jgi:predicted aminopeptidase
MRKILLLTCFSFLWSSCYLTKQGYKQLELLDSREPIDQALNDTKTSDREKTKLKLTQNVLSFAKEQKLNVGSAYQKFIRLRGEAVSYTVQAAMPTEIKLKTWWFPFLGSVPDLGFFDQSDRDLEAKSLEEKGFEIHRGAVTAYSSLGWFADPVYSSMLRRSDAELAHLYFHELTHRTLWLKDGVEFNENLAEFVAGWLTEDFFNAHNRKAELVDFKMAAADYELFKGWLKELRRNLESTLESNKDQPEPRRIEEKNRVIALAVSKKPAFKLIDYVGSAPWNNARILSAALYSPDTSAFLEASRCYRFKAADAKAGNFLKALEKLSENTSNGFEALKAMCNQ